MDQTVSEPNPKSEVRSPKEARSPKSEKSERRTIIADTDRSGHGKQSFEPSNDHRFGFRTSLLLAACLSIAAVQPPTPATPLPPEQAAKEGRALVDEILSQTPAQNTTNTGVMTINDKNDQRTRIPVRFEVFNTDTNWCSRYQAADADVTVIHDSANPNQYQVKTSGGETKSLSGNEAMIPFAGSDFWLADLGLEFFHWPEQHVVRKEMKRSRSCKVLESVNPRPSSGGYSRVLSWIDNESHGIVMAQAFDAKGKVLKVFIPKKVEKVNGQWQLQEMEIDNTQAGSSTRVDFDLNK
jgi:Outer membrane lipoprotein-sorting protein